MQRPRLLVFAAVFGDDAEIRQQAPHARLVAGPFANREARLVVLDRLVVVAALRRDGADEFQHAADAALLPQRAELARRAFQPRQRLVEPALLARDLGQRRFARRLCVVVGEFLRNHHRLAVDLLGATPIADELQHLPQFQQHIDPLALLHQRRQPLEIVDRGPIRVGRLGGIAGAAQVLALLRQIVAAPVVVREDVEVAIDGIDLGCLDVMADPLVQHRPDRERHALVRDFLGNDVLEEIRLQGFLFDDDEVVRTERSQMILDLVQGPELGVDARHRRRPERASQARSRP